MNRLLRQTDHTVYTLIRQEYMRQKRGLELDSFRKFYFKIGFRVFGFGFYK